MCGLGHRHPSILSLAAGTCTLGETATLLPLPPSLAGPASFMRAGAGKGPSAASTPPLGERETSADDKLRLGRHSHVLRAAPALQATVATDEAICPVQQVTLGAESLPALAAVAEGPV